MRNGFKTTINVTRIEICDLMLACLAAKELAGDEELVFRGEKAEAMKYEQSLRRECRRVDPNGVEMDCYTMSDEALEMSANSIKLWDTLTEEQKQDIIEVDGRKYVRAIYEATHRKVG